MAWLAKQLDDGVAQWLVQNLQDGAHYLDTPFRYLWYDASIAATPPSTLPTWHLADTRGIYAWRSSWMNDATYFSLKSGNYFGAHEHPDAGHWLLFRAGVPYITDEGYSYDKQAKDHNVVLVGGAGQYGQDSQFMLSVDPVHWAEVPVVLSDAAYFDLTGDPSAMSMSAALTAWNREVVGLTPGIFFIRDALAAASATEFTWLMHSYKTSPPASSGSSYDPNTLRLENPFVDQGGARWLIRPQTGAPDLHLADCSGESWSANIEPFIFVPESRLDGGGYNASLLSYQRGFELRRSRSDTATSSLFAAWFGDTLAAQALTSVQAEGVRLYDTSNDIAVVVWPTGATATNVAGLTVTGDMGGRRMDEPAYFGRNISQLEHDGQLLVQAPQAVSLFARTEHTSTPTEPRRVVITTSASVAVQLYCPLAPTQVRLDGTSMTFGWNAGLLSVTIPAGTHTLLLL